MYISFFFTYVFKTPKESFIYFIVSFYKGVTFWSNICNKSSTDA